MTKGLTSYLPGKCRNIGISDSSLKRWCDQGMIETVRAAGGHHKMLIAEVLRFVRGGKAKNWGTATSTKRRQHATLLKKRTNWTIGGKTTIPKEKERDSI